MTVLSPYNDDYSSCDQTYAELRVYSGDLLPAEVSSRLGLEPTTVNERGKQRVSLTTGRTRTLPLNAWFVSSEGLVVSKDLRRHLDWVLDRIEPAADAICALQTVPGVRIEISCSWWSATGNGGPTLSPPQMRRMAELGLECAFEVMFFPDE